MAASRQMGGCRISRPDDSTPPRRSATFGLLTPESPTGLRSFDLRPTSPPSSPTPLRNIPKVIKPSTFHQGKQSKRSSKKSTTSRSIALPPLAEPLTPDNTPPRKTKPITRNAKTRVKSESSLLPTPDNTPALLFRGEEVKVRSEPSHRQTALLARVTKREDVQCIVKHDDEQDTGSSISSTNVKPKPQRLKSKKTAANPTKDRNEQCRGFTGKRESCIRAAEPASQYCYQHKSQINGTPTYMTGTPYVRETVQCSGISNKNRLCQLRVVVTPGRPKDDPAYCRHHLPKTVAGASDREFEVRRVGRETVFVSSCVFIPSYLQPETQKRLAGAVRDFWRKVEKPGYVYVLNVIGPKKDGKLWLKIGYSDRVKKRFKEWITQCGPRYKDVRAWWPGCINNPKDYDGPIEKYIARNQQGLADPLAKQLERLVLIEIEDLATNAPYLHSNFPFIDYSDVRPQIKPASEACSTCTETHQEIFSFRRFEEGYFYGKEWDYIIKPVIRKWALFLTKYFAERD